MNLEELEKDLANVKLAIEQSMANHNILIGQKQGLEHALSKIKEAAKVTENVIDIAEKVLEPTKESANA